MQTVVARQPRPSTKARGEVPAMAQSTYAPDEAIWG